MSGAAFFIILVSFVLAIIVGISLAKSLTVIDTSKVVCYFITFTLSIILFITLVGLMGSCVYMVYEKIKYGETHENTYVYTLEDTIEYQSVNGEARLIKLWLRHGDEYYNIYITKEEYDKLNIENNQLTVTSEEWNELRR